MWLLGLAVVVGVVFGLTLWSEMSSDINRSPEISFTEDAITVSVADGDEVLLEGVTATDPEDGDVTDSVVIEGLSEFADDYSRQVTYVAFDSNNNVTKATRTIYYSDYSAPVIELTSELKVTVGEQINIQDCVSVSDVLDGNITNLLQVTESNYDRYTAGEYSVTLKVTNSAGDTTEQAFTIECVDASEATSVGIVLTTYSVTLDEGADFDPEDYLDSVTGRDKYGEQLTVDDVKITNPVNTSEPGTYTVIYTLTGDGETGTTRLTVIVN
ncbi:MAG: DUF5011 domain-containing protein [Clostridiales bacterium]|nr:DUF5011 domain-containing protein [Clostridiales bacterium]